LVWPDRGLNPWYTPL